MQARPTEIPDVVVLEPRVFKDPRGFFLEHYNRRTLRDVAGIDFEFVQDNHSRSARGVLRGLHYQVRQAQGKLVRVTAGSIWDVAVDLRRSAATFGRWVALELRADTHRVLWIPPGFAHGFLVTSEFAEVQYKTTDYYAPEHERTLAWDDSQLAIAWPVTGDPTLSAKDRAGLPLERCETFA